MPRNRYGAKSTNPMGKRTTRTKPLVRRRPGMRLTKKKAKNLKGVNNRLKDLRTAVKKLQSRTYGELQLDAQAFYHRGDTVHSPDTPYIYDLCAEQPVMFCPQAIRRGAAAWQIRYDSSGLPGQRFNSLQIGSFDKQKFAYQVLNEDPVPGLDLRYKTTHYWDNSLGVQPKYLLKNSNYEFQVSANGVTGYVELCALSQARNFHASTAAQNYAFPSGARSYINTCKGTIDCNPISQQVTKVRVLKRIYFQYAGIRSNDGNPPYVGTGKYFGPRNVIFRIQLKHNNVIAVTVLEPSTGSGVTNTNSGAIAQPAWTTAQPGQVIDYTEIPLEQQTWLMFRTSIPKSDIPGEQVPGSDPPIYYPAGHDTERRLEVQMRRIVSFRDALGNSLA